MNANRNRLDELEKSTERIQLDRNAIETSLRTQKDELDKLRHEASQWEAKFVEMQQDRGDVQVIFSLLKKNLEVFFAKSVKFFS